MLDVMPGRRHHRIAMLVGALAALAAPAAPAAAQHVYVVNGSQQFGTLDVATGAFRQIGPNTAQGSAGLAAAPGGSLYTLTYGGDLATIDPGTGLMSIIGPTGLGDCSIPGISPCGPMSANTLARLGGKFETEELPPANLKGKEKPFRMFDVKRAHPSVQVPGSLRPA